ncbi:unnamed protein product [Rangifer tarandus platyrhynchus]|uniref:Uncharacterized protein n=2 Tax=Rangifer tarandus platyrhynchus TaxID=3082113 RepID=A0ABN9A155_RANTA|nr:unnamed protein product [Rangifer tarandus platyrhynchus]CAI9712335.1 unnamed protein product [Rangifer tarandus platyrhynchus]
MPLRPPVVGSRVTKGVAALDSGEMRAGTLAISTDASKFQIPVLKGRVVWRRPWAGAVQVGLALQLASLGSPNAEAVCVSPSGAECPQATLSTFHARIRGELIPPFAQPCGQGFTESRHP